MSSTPNGPDDFHGRIEVCPLDRLTATQAVGSAQVVRRDRAAIARSQRDCYYLISQPRSAWRVVHAGQDRVVQPGESVLVDSRRPYEFQFPYGLDDLSMALPIDWLERWIPDPLLGLAIQAQSGWGLALRGMREALVPAAVPGLPVLPRAVEEQFGFLLGMASGRLSEAPVRSNAIVARCEAHMREA